MSKKQPRNILDSLVPDGASHREVVDYLQKFFTSCVIEDNGDLLYPADAANYTIRVRGVGGRIRRIEAGPGFNAMQFDRLRREIHNLLVQSPGDTVARVVAFTSPVPLRGSYFASDAQLQLVEAPGHAPRPDTLHGSHPMLLEFRIRRSSDFGITNRRRLNIGTEWAWILNALLRVRVWTPTARSQRLWVGEWEPVVRSRVFRRLRRTSHWVTRGRLPREPEPEAYVVKWLQEGYDYADWSPIADAYSAVPNGVAVVPHDHYYAEDYLRQGDVAELPDSLASLLAAAASLSPDHRDRYIRAASWLHAAGRMWDITTSAWFISFVAAIETLMPPPTERCPECNAWRNITQNFRDFVGQYAPSSDHQKLGAVYDMRSKLAHGSRLIELDEAPWSFGARMSVGAEYSAIDQLTLAVREVMLNWLVAHQTRNAS